MGDAEVGGPGGVLVLPARVNVVDVVVVEEVGAVDGELVVGVKLAFQGEGGGPRVGGVTGQDEHAVVDGGAVDGAQGILQRRRVVGVRGGGEDDVPEARDVVDFRSPEVGGPRLATGGVGAEDDARLGIVPVVGEGPAALEGDVVVGGVGEEVPVLAVDRVPRHPRVAEVDGRDGVAVSGIGGLVGADSGWVPALRAGLVGIKGLAVDSRHDGQHQQTEEVEDETGSSSHTDFTGFFFLCYSTIHSTWMVTIERRREGLYLVYLPCCRAHDCFVGCQDRHVHAQQTVNAIVFCAGTPLWAGPSPTLQPPSTPPHPKIGLHRYQHGRGELVTHQCQLINHVPSGQSSGDLY